MQQELSEFIQLLEKSVESGVVTDRRTFLSEKRRICESLGLSVIPKNGEILAELGEPMVSKFSSTLKSKPVRTLSGVTVVAMMTKPFDCPHGTCLFCPGGTRFNTPQSYTGFEPAARRARFNDYDPYAQTISRLKHYTFLGYSPEKIEVIVIGGTFTTLPKQYRDDFVTGIYRAMNDFSSGLERGGQTTLDAEKRRNETAKFRCVTFAIETKPERCGEDDIKQLLDYGVTRVEMGVQSVFDDVLQKNNRGHTIKDVMDSTKELRDHAFKVDHHVMLNMPFSDIDKDRETIRRVYEDDGLKPDAIKIYPTLVIKGTGLYSMWKAGEHQLYSAEDIVDLVAEAESTAPRWLRIMRVERDIPSDKIEGGVKSTNLRQIVAKRLAQLGKRPNDIRGREVGHVKLTRDQEIRFNRENYRAAGGDEIFLSVDDVANDAIIGFLRLRIPDSSVEGLVRELHIYGEQKNISERGDIGFQHKGLGSELLKRAEIITKQEYSVGNIKIISGVGVRDYYRKYGYRLENNYMVKKL